MSYPCQGRGDPWQGGLIRDTIFFIEIWSKVRGAFIRRGAAIRINMIFGVGWGGVGWGGGGWNDEQWGGGMSSGVGTCWVG